MQDKTHTDMDDRIMAPGLLRRIAAILYDIVLIFSAWATGFAIIYLALAFLFNIEDFGNHPLFKLYTLLVPLIFYLWFWTHGGQTLGMKTWRLRVLREDGGSLSLRDALIRYVTAVLSLLPGGLGFLWSLIDKDHRTWHDILSHTRLVMLNKNKS